MNSRLCLGNFFRRVDCRNRVSVFHTRYVGAKQTGALLDVSLGKILLVAQCPQALTDIVPVFLLSVPALYCRATNP